MNLCRPYLGALIVLMCLAPSAYGQTTSEKLAALVAPPVWRVDTTATDAGGNTITRLSTLDDDVAYASGSHPDSLLTFLARVGGEEYLLDFGSVPADSLYRLGFSVPDSVIASWNDVEMTIRISAYVGMRKVELIFDP